MSKRGKEKGNEAERLVAKKILEAAGAPFRKEDCYRTPMSGGHPFADAGDLVISPPLREVFPFTVEVKHHKEWRPAFAFNSNKIFFDWVAQAQSQEHDKRAAGRKLLLVMSGNNTGWYAAMSAERFEEYVVRAQELGLRRPVVTFPVLFFSFDNGRYVMIRFEDFCAAVTLNAKRSKKK